MDPEDASPCLVAARYIVLLSRGLVAARYIVLLIRGLVQPGI